jgi:hypothetical protein
VAAPVGDGQDKSQRRALAVLNDATMQAIAAQTVAAMGETAGEPRRSASR